MTTTELRQTDSKGRLTLPKQFANATLLLEIRGDNEIILRKAKVVPLDESEVIPPFSTLQPLSAADTEAFLAALDDPTPPNAALKKLLRQK